MVDLQTLTPGRFKRVVGLGPNHLTHLVWIAKVNVVKAPTCEKCIVLMMAIQWGVYL